MVAQQSVVFVTERRGGWDEWGSEREILVDIETPSERLSPHEFVRVRREGEEFEAQLEPVDSYGDPGGTCVVVKSAVPQFESEVLDENQFGVAWGEWLFPSRS